MNIAQLLSPKSTVSYLFDDNTIRQALECMRARGYTALPVINREGRYVGSVSEGDFLWHIINCREESLREPESFLVQDIIRENFNPAVKIDTGIEVLLKQVMNQNFVPVVDDRNSFIGIVTRKDVIQYFVGKE